MSDGLKARETRSQREAEYQRRKRLLTDSGKNAAEAEATVRIEFPELAQAHDEVMKEQLRFARIARAANLRAAKDGTAKPAAPPPHVEKTPKEWSELAERIRRKAETAVKYEKKRPQPLPPITPDQLDEMLARSGVEKEFRNIDISNLSPWLPPQYHRAAEWLINLAAKKLAGLIIGQSGLGKTGLACGLIIHLYKSRAGGGRIIRPEQFFMLLNSNGRRDFNEQFNRFVETPLLIIDEAVQETHRAGTEERNLSELIKARCGAKRATLLISNLTKEQIDFALEKALTRRIEEQGGIWTCDWPTIQSVKPQ